MADRHFEHPRLAAIYDALDADRRDLQPYLDLVAALGASKVLDVGCGTGVFALQLAARGVDVVGVDPAGGSLDVARAKHGAARVRWIHGDASSLPPMQVDVATMTANVAQAIVDPPAWEGTLRGVHAALRHGGRLVFETRDPGRPRLGELEPCRDLHDDRRPRRRHRRDVGRAHRGGGPVGELPVDVRVQERWGGADVGLHAAVPGAR